jgi:hypothetical protein
MTFGTMLTVVEHCENPRELYTKAFTVIPKYWQHFTSKNLTSSKKQKEKEKLWFSSLSWFNIVCEEILFKPSLYFV